MEQKEKIVQNDYSKNTLDLDQFYNEQQYQELTIDHLREGMNMILTEICEENIENDELREVNDIKIRMVCNSFISKSVPSISIKNYLSRIIKYTKIEVPSLIATLIYIDRICYKKKLSLSFHNIFKLLISSFVISCKFNEDHIYDNQFYSKVGGIPLSELNKLESNFLILIGYDLFIKEEDYNKYYHFFFNNYKSYEQKSEIDNCKIKENESEARTLANCQTLESDEEKK